MMHIHKWSKWTTPYHLYVRVPVSYLEFKTVKAWYQKRECTKCGKIKVKSISSKGLA